MFKGIRVKLLKRGKIQKVRLFALLQDFEDRISALEEANGTSSTDDEDTGSDDESGSQGTNEPTTPKFNLSITVKDEDNNPVQGAEVSLFVKGDSTLLMQSTTGSAGGCTLKDVPQGDYQLYAGKQSENIITDPLLEITVNKDSTSFTINTYHADRI